jgi:hypothetical protein
MIAAAVPLSLYGGGTLLSRSMAQRNFSQGSVVTASIASARRYNLLSGSI